MKRSTLFISFLVLGVGLALVLTACGSGTAPTAAPAQPAATQAPAVAPTKAATPTAASSAAPSPIGDPLRGGMLYDKWWTVVGVDAPADDHPLWKTQTTNTRTGTATWRCKECHGWDYLGADGAYGGGSHKTGFVGVKGVAGQDANDILAILKGSTNPDHDFSKVMDDQALIDLALFLSEEQVDFATMVSKDKLPVNGNAEAGKLIFDDNCADCHGPRGTAINFANAAGPEYLGTLGKDNPWEFLHKARVGQPGVPDMPSLVDAGLETQGYADLLAFVQTLPTESPVTEGGELYDKWWAALGLDAPQDDQPLWKTQTTNTRTGADTWRCKECHGWDYRGVDGAYGSGSHKTGFKGIFDSAALSEQDLTDWLTGKTNPDHDFSAYLKEPQVKMLVAFIQKGLVDTQPYINADKTVQGDADKGKSLYEGVCKICHGDDGKALNFGDDNAPEYVGTIAKDNPWEFWHKVSFGQPGAHMPAGLNFDWTPDEYANLLAYTQTLPEK